MVLSGRVALLAALGAVLVGPLTAVISGAVAVVSITGLIIALLLTDCALAASTTSLRLTRTGASTVRLGESARVTTHVTNDGPRRMRCVVRDAWAPSAGVDIDRHKLELSPGTQQRVTTQLRPTRRGDHHCDHVTIRSWGPLSLAGRQRSRHVPWTVRALPPFLARRHLRSRLRRLAQLNGQSTVNIRGAGTEFDSLREYVIGDDTRSIDWRATARASDVVVRTWRPESDRHVVIVLDTGRTSAARVGDAPKLDAAMDSALLLGALAARAGDRVDLLAYDRTMRARVTRPSSSDVLRSLANAMAPLEAELVETDYRGLAAQLMRQAGQHAFIVLLTGLDSAAVEQGLLPVLPQLTRRHTLLVASVADPELDELAASRESADAVYTAAAAEYDRFARTDTATHLRNSGAHVVDATPEDLPPLVADTYLNLKATGTL